MKKFSGVSALAGFFLFSLFLCAPAGADYEKGLEAHKQGDYAEALHQWLTASADPRCVTAIGVMYEYGEGLPRDDDKAAEWYTKAAEKGEYRAIARLAAFSLTGAGGVTQTPEEWRGKLETIEGKDAYADYVLARFYMDGHGGSENLQKALAILRELSEKGYPRLEPLLKRLERRLDDEKSGVLKIDFLIAEEARSQASFDQDFRDRRLTVSGWIESVDPLGDLGYVIRLGGSMPGGSQDSALAVFYDPDRVETMPRLKPRAFVKLNGIYVGKHPFPLGDSAFTLFGCALLDVLLEEPDLEEVDR